MVYETIRAEHLGRTTNTLNDPISSSVRQDFYQIGMVALVKTLHEYTAKPKEKKRVYGHQRILNRCLLCGRSYSQTRGTAYFNSKLDLDTYDLIVGSLAKGMGIRAIARVYGKNPDTILHILKTVGHHCYTVNRHFLMKDFKVNNCQLDELWTIVERKKLIWKSDQWICDVHNDTWVWSAFDTKDKLLLAWHVGARSPEDASAFISKLKVVLPTPPALFTSDDFSLYREPLLMAYGRKVIPPRTGKRGRPMHPYWEPGPELRYAQVMKRRQGKKVVESKIRLTFGVEEEIDRIVSSSGYTINTSFVERRNLTFRQDNRRLCRDTLSFSKKVEMLRLQLELSVAYSHLVRTHKTLKHTVSLSQKCTPMMAKGLTDHAWTVRELLTYNPNC